MSALVFAVPLALAALIALPALYYLLRLTPPPPRRLPLPTLPLVKDIIGAEREPSRTPWWLLAIRLACAAAIILAAAGPRWQPEESGLSSSAGPLVLMLDDGWAAAPDWKARIGKATSVINDASSRPILLLVASDERPGTAPVASKEALARLLSLSAQPYQVPREAMLDAAARLLKAESGASAIFLSDGITNADEQLRINSLLAEAGARLTVIKDNAGGRRAIIGIAQDGEGMDVRVRRVHPNAKQQAGIVRAFDEKGRALGEAPFSFGMNDEELRARLSMPLELLNDMSRIEIVEEGHAAGVYLMDAASRRRRVALVSGETTDTSQPLVSARYFVTRAFQPFSDLREPPRGVPDPIRRALEERPDVLVLVDIGTLSGETAEIVTRFVENGGMLIRFAGPGLAAASDDLLPVRLRRGGRILGGALSWDKPQRLGAFPETSPFAGLNSRDDIRVERQVLAEPDSDITRASWAVLEDGTPLVTGAARGRGQIVLFHVTGDTGWSNLPLSGVFVDMLRRCLSLALSRATGQADIAKEQEKLSPRLTLNGSGVLSTPPASASPIEARHTAPASREHPPGFYGPPEAGVALNVTSVTSPFIAIDFNSARVQPLEGARAFELRPIFMLIAAMLLIADALAVAWLASGGWQRRFSRQAVIGLTGIGLLALVAGLLLPTMARAQQPAITPPRSEDVRSALKPRLAYVITGNPSVDEASRAGLTGLTQVLGQRTSIQLDEPIALDPAKDELVFYSMLYWPILPELTRPPEATSRAIDAFMKNGGTILFDTRDAFVQRSNGQPTPETRALRRVLAALDIPSLEPVPPDHVLTKTFYLLDRMIGRYMAGDTWVEALVGTRDTKTPARAGDRVSPIIITSNDLASAWAIDRLGRPLYPLVPGEPRQREMALRTGVNLVMYVMTGNYKADQVHVPALLERLGQ